ncbi:AraC family transcriptional regulator [Poseidonibacter ostreae]|uniref:Helix-turn-helix domain-containing protein n=1 Tax=Poseidonibacter ostreae TaxID=2654171 RepID=A0A6L4WWL2_9BACT|nr:GyrI-like domain-containing protein [Poseidonibacter ostreae]KAB7888868.1 helix-turn-helix domain-containing protein [Poseidonibacter ostreae]KAB7889641.1 helix-turn-helix domain-containing protein [Poseidonibacter ostreae]
MKKDTKHIRADIVNQSLNYIYKYIDTDIKLEELAKLNSVSKYHFHRIFKEETGENLFDRISTIRLQKAANLLITNTYSTISEIANMCGYSSHTSFIKAFKKRFIYTPSQWRKGEYKNFTKDKLDLEENFHEIFKDIEPIIKVVPTKICAYIRHKGYDGAALSKLWQRLLAFSYQQNIKDSIQIGIYHDNTIIIPYEECNYIAALEVEPSFKPTNSISKFEVLESLCAVFHYEGKYGDICKLMTYIYQYWMPGSGYEAMTLPSYVIYHKNHYLEENDSFSLDFYVPIRVV